MACKTDNGRALAKLVKLIGSLEAYIQFTDGKIYLVSPVHDSELLLLGGETTQPGCWFNKVLRLRMGYKAMRVQEIPKFQAGAISMHWAEPIQ